jgi:hypothetical protein
LDQKGVGLEINEVWPEGQPPFKEIKLDEETELEEETKRFFLIKIFLINNFLKFDETQKGIG